MVSTLPPVGPEDVDIPGNVSLHGTGTGNSSAYLPPNATPGDSQFYLPLSQGVDIVVFMVMVSVCSVMGTLGNIPVLLVYCRKTDRRTTNTFIRVLSVIDLVVCAIIMPYSMVMELHLITSDIACRVLEFVRHTSIGASNLTLVAIAIERYMAVCVITRRLTVRNVNQGMLVVMAVSVVLAVPSMGIFAVVTKEEVKNVNCAFPYNFSSTFSFCHFTTSVLGPVLSTVYQTTLMIFFFIPFITIAILYTVVYTSLRKRAKRRSLMQSFSVEVDISSNERPRSKGGSSQEPDGEDKHEEKIELKTNGLVICPAGLGSEASILDRPEVERLQSWTTTGREMQSSRVRRLTKRQSDRRRRMARMLFLCSVVFLISWLPFWVDVFSHSHNLFLRYLFFVGNASNPLVYGISNSNFRQSLLRLLAGGRPRCRVCKRD